MDTPLGRDIVEHSKIEEIKALLTDDVAYRVYVINTFNQMHEQFKYQEKLLGVYQTSLDAIHNTLNNRMNTYDTVLSECIEKIADKSKSGISGFLDKAWTQFTNKFAWIFVAVIMWALLKTFLFGEGPFGSLLGFHLEKKSGVPPISESDGK